MQINFQGLKRYFELSNPSFVAYPDLNFSARMFERSGRWPGFSSLSVWLHRPIPARLDVLL